MRALSLFSGCGGADLALEAAGYEVAALCEIEPHARAVLREHWPNVPLLGDVSLVDGTQWKDVQIVVGGSPCQDLSVAGKRAGLTDGSGTRSSLFFQQVRIWNETGSPYLIWENVYGALSSNGGADFAAVLSALVGAAIAVPRDGWERGGVASGRAAVAAWRVLDLQHFGVPQRRERVVVLAARAGGVDPAEVLALGESLSWDSPPRYEAREGTAGAAQGGAGARRGLAANFSDAQGRLDTVAGSLQVQSKGGGGVGAQWVGAVQEVVAPLTTGAGSRGGDHENFGGHLVVEPIAPPIALTLTHQYAEQSGQDDGMAIVPRTASPPETRRDRSPKHSSATSSSSGGGFNEGTTTYAIGSHAGAAEGEATNASPASGGPVGLGIQLEVSHSLRAGRAGLVAPIAHTLRGEGHDASEDGTGRGTPMVVAPTPPRTLAFKIRGGVEVDANGNGAGKGYLGSEETAFTLGVSQDQSIMAPNVAGLGVRMLMPVEAEAIMGWDRDWTRYGVNEKGVRYELKDTPRYRLCGNGQAREWGEWIYARLMDAERNGSGPH